MINDSTMTIAIIIFVLILIALFLSEIVIMFPESSIEEEIKSKITPTDSVVRTKAVQIAREHPGEWNIEQACDIYDWIKENIRYVSDPRGIEYIAPPRETIIAGGGDCDDIAILSASLIEAIGGSSRIVLIYKKGGGHAVCEVYAGNKRHTKDLIDYLDTRYMWSFADFYGWEIDENGGCWLIFDPAGGNWVGDIGISGIRTSETEWRWDGEVSYIYP